MNFKSLPLPDAGLVVVAGRPAIGKSYVMIEIANSLIRDGMKAVLAYTDGEKAHDIVRYVNGEVRSLPSKLSRVNDVYPEIPYVVENGGEWFFPSEWEMFLNDYIDHEKPQAILINSIVPPREKVSVALMKKMQRIAKEKHIIIFVEIQVSNAIERRKENHPKLKDIKCSGLSRKYVDQFIFVYRNVYDTEAVKSKTIEVYSINGEKVILPFYPEKYGIEKDLEKEG